MLDYKVKLFRTYLYSLKHSSFVDFMVPGIHHTDSFRPPLLCRSNRCPKYSLSSTTSITVTVD